MSLHTRIMAVAALLLSVVFLPTTFMLFVGMVPTMAAFFFSLSKRRTAAITVGAMNLAGCTPFMLEMWMQGQTFEKAVDIVMNAETIVVMYSAAAVGWMIDWSMSGIVASVLYQKGLSRRGEIQRRQRDLIERWGEEVTGAIPLDEHGFPILKPPAPRT